MDTIRSFLGNVHAGFEGLDRPAACHTASTLSFDALFRRSNALASDLASGTGPVLLRGHKHVEFLIGYWACLLAGRAVVPIEPDTPLQRVAEIAAKCGAKLCLETCPDRADLSGLGLELKDLTGYKIEASKFEPLPRPAEAPAYILFSSGTTGKPKGIKVSYANVRHFAEWVDSDLMARDMSAAVSGTIRYCFDVSLFEMWFSWMRRVPISVLDHDDFMNSRLCVKRYHKHGVGLWVTTPSAVKLYLRDKQFCGENLPAIRTFLFCGEVLPKKTVAELFNRFPNARVVNTYGPTECTVAVTSVQITAEHMNTPAPLPIGSPRPGCRLEVEDGQITITGRNVVGLGYVRLPQKQQAAFPAPDRYRTGDIGYTDARGQWYFSGRADREIKIQGIRIDLDEIEAHIREQNGVETAHVEPYVIHDDIRGINAFVCGPRNETELADLANSSARNMASWMMPRFWYAHPGFKINRNSKLDRGEFARVAQTQGVRYVYC